MDNMNNELEILKQALEYEKRKVVALQNTIKVKEELVLQAKELANFYATGKLMALNHFFFRLKGQYFQGNAEDKVEFWKWIKGKISKTNRNLGEGINFNPLMIINEKLNEVLSYNEELKLMALKEDFTGEVTEENNLEQITLNPNLAHILEQPYQKQDVLILSVIDYNFRHQRPQHFATRFADNGHRVFYVNANFVREDSCKELDNCLNIVDFRNFEHNAVYTMQGTENLPWMKEKFDELIYANGIRDAVIVVDYPNWVYAAEYMRKQYGFKIVIDYMDDFTGFLGTAEDFLKDNCIHLLKTSDVVVASSQFLYDVAAKYVNTDKIRIIRNGTEVDHFITASVSKEHNRTRKIIGYYGAVSHWFSYEKVCYVAKNMPGCDVVVIGEVTDYKKELSSIKNIKLLGEINYKVLPEHLEYFDVCLIPFDTSTDLIKATNPVKFYEYLSAGKKVVATEIPELEPFRDEFVYMSNDDATFLNYVKMCLDGTDSLKDKEESITFAKENDWQKRFEAFDIACKNQTPKVSIVVLTYNNLALNKQCIASILKQTAYSNYELIVVDNNSQDGTKEYLQNLREENLENVKIILNEANSGFAGGNNIGIAQSDAKYILLLNNDTIVTRGWLTNMVKHMEEDSNCGMCGCVTNSIGNEAMVKAKYTTQKELQEFAYSYTHEHMNKLYTHADRIAMFCTIIKRSILEKSKGLDAGYKVGMFEDDDYAQVILNEGCTFAIAEDTFIHHVNNASFKKLEDKAYAKIFKANRERFEKKWNVEWHMPKYRAGVTADSNQNVKVEMQVDEI